MNKGNRQAKVGAHSGKPADVEQPDYVVVCSKSDSGSDESENTAIEVQDKNECTTQTLKETPDPCSSISFISSTMLYYSRRFLKAYCIKKSKEHEPEFKPLASEQEQDNQPTNKGATDGLTSSQAQSQNTDSTDTELGRFVVCIHDGVEENSAAFRVSPDQTVLRVLKGACKHFKLDFAQ